MKNWKTTLIAFLLAAFVAIEPLISTGQIDWKKIVLAALIAGFGAIAKDANVTGGTVAQTPEAEKRTEGK